MYLFALFLLCATASLPLSARQPLITALWHAGDNGYDTYRIPGIVVASDGTVLAYSVGRKHLADGDWSDSDIFLRRSMDRGKTWLPSQHIAGNGQGVTDNPVAIASHVRGEVHFLYQHDYASVFYQSSKDDGASFSAPVEITTSLADLREQFPWNVVALGPGHGIQMENGRLVVPVWLAAGKETSKGRRQHAPSAITTIFSDDNGRTWKHGDVIAVDSPEMKNPNELQVIQLIDGRVMANIRTGDPAMQRAVAYSPDGATRWSKPVFDSQLFDPICAAGITRYSGRELLFTNPDSRDLPVENGHGRRFNLTVRLSLDDGKTWSMSRRLVEGPTGYSDIAVAGKDILDVYEVPEEFPKKPLSVFVRRFDLDWVKSGH